MFTEEDVVHVLRLVLSDNLGNRITEALGMGIEAAALHYLNAIKTTEPKESK